MFKAAMLWNWAILCCSIIEDMDIFWTKTLLTKLQSLTFYIIHLLDRNPSNKVAVYIIHGLESVDCHVLEVVILSNMKV